MGLGVWGTALRGNYGLGFRGLRFGVYRSRGKGISQVPSVRGWQVGV